MGYLVIYLCLIQTARTNVLSSLSCAIQKKYIFLTGANTRALYFQVPEIRDEDAYSPDNSSVVLDWKTSQPVSRSSSIVSTRRCISALSPQVTSSLEKKRSAWCEKYFLYEFKQRGSFYFQSDATECALKYPSSEKAYKIVLAGDAAVGKSSFLMRLCKNEFRGNTSATLGIAVLKFLKLISLLFCGSGWKDYCLWLLARVSWIYTCSFLGCEI